MAYTLIPKNDHSTCPLNSFVFQSCTLVAKVVQLTDVLHGLLQLHFTKETNVREHCGC
jgi:hypothetical protein